MNPDNNLLRTEELRRLQLSELEILLEFKQICDANNLKYFITAGTLLGAVRHKGFIPWDDDIDVAMPRDDFNKLSEICKSQLADGFYYQDSYTEKNYPYFFAKIRKANTEVYEPCLEAVDIRKGQYIDIFPLDVCPKNPTAAKNYFKLIWLLTWCYMGKVNRNFVCGYTRLQSKLAYSILKALPLKTIRGLRDQIAVLPGKLGKPKVLCTVGGAHGYPAESYLLEWFSNSEEMEFEGICFTAPKGWHEILSNMYGDYSKPPKDSERRGHFEKLEEKR